MSRARTRATFLVAPLLLVAIASATPASAAGELVKNPLLTQGANDTPLHWRNEAYTPGPQATRFKWMVGPEGIGTLEVNSTTPNDARWVQKIPVSTDTWYRVSGWIRTENVGAETMGAYISAMGTFNNSRDLRGTQGWQPVGFWVKTGSLETSLEIACRLGGYSSLNQGAAWFTGISVEAAGVPPAGEPHVYGGSVEEDKSGRPIAAQVAAVLVAVGLALLVWRYVLPPSAQIPR